jgi:hypothetical protein
MVDHNSPTALFEIYTDAYGSNIYFSGVSNGVSYELYASAPISWSLQHVPSNWH